MSFRNTFITDFIYMSDPVKLEKIRALLQEHFEHVHFSGERGYGYFHGYFKDLSPRNFSDSLQEKEIKKRLRSLHVKIKVIYE